MHEDLTKRAREIFIELSTLDETKANSELDRLVGNDDELREVVVQLLKDCNDADSAELMNAPTAMTISPITESAGSQIGPYKILQQIGEGGFGTVFLAEQSKPIRRRVALKIIKLGMDTKQVIARFEAERQALALMDHPNIARVLDAGATDTGRPYFVMEYVVGDAITKFADVHKLTVKDRLKLFSQVCSAVQHAHTKGIIHRDIKPSNILVSMTDGKPFAKVIDFGIAKATASSLTEKTLFTEHHQLIGTPEYMSSEQAEGLPDIDTRTDVYALGVLLYELLTGQTPIDGTRLRSAAWNEMRRMIKEEEPPAPSMRLSRDVIKLAGVASARQAEPTKLSEMLKGELDWITIKALDKDRNRRYETPNALGSDVQRHLEGDAVHAAPPSAGYRFKKYARRHKVQLSMAAILLLGLTGTSGGLVLAQMNAKAALHNADLAIKANENTEWSAYTANLALAQMSMDNGNWPEARERIAACPESKRGWEWEFLSNKAKSVFVEFEGSKATLSPDGHHIATVVDFRRVRVWDTDGNPISKFMDHDQRVDIFVFSPDSQHILTVAIGEPVRVWNLAGELVGQSILYDDWLTSAVFGLDGKSIVVTEISGKTRILDFDGNELCKPITNKYINWWALRLSSEGYFVAANSSDKKYMMDLYNLQGEKIGKPMFAKSASFFSSFSNDGQYFSSISSDNTVSIWDTDGNPIGQPMPHDMIVRSATFSSNNNFLMTSTDDQRIRFWSFSGSQFGAELPHDHWAGVPLMPTEEQVLTAHNGSLLLWDTRQNILSSGQWPVDDLFPYEIVSDGRSVLCGYGNVMEGIDGICIIPLSLNSPDRSLRGAHVALSIAAEFGRSISPKVVTNQTPAWIHMATSLTTHPDGARIVTAASDNTVRIWDPKTQKELAAISMNAGVTNLTFTPDGTRLVIELDDGSARIFDTRSAEDQAADVQRRWAERVPAGVYLDALMAGMTPTEELMSIVETDPSLTPIRRLAAAEVLVERLADIKHEAARAFDTITKDQTDKSTVQTAAANADLPTRIKQQVLTKAEQWKYTPPKISTKDQLAEETKQRRGQKLIDENDD